MLSMRVLPGLPPYGPLATGFPGDWGRLGREGFVVEFVTEAGRWVANFKPGLGGLDLVAVHPNNVDAVVVAHGDLWLVRPRDHTAEKLLSAIDAAFDVHNPDGWVFSRQGVALVRFGPAGLIWHTRRISWDGFDHLTIQGRELTGLAWSPLDDRLHPFRVDLSSGRSVGGSFFEEDEEGWEQLAE
jgi:hypothetical protein